MDGHPVLTCQRNELGEPDESGRRRPVPIKGSEFDTQYDTIIAAIGQVSDVPKGFGVEVDRGNVIKTNPKTLETSRKGVYAGGDVAIGPDSVIRAIAQGRVAASSIDKALGGSGVIDEVLTPDRTYNAKVGRVFNFINLRRAGLGELEVKERINNFKEVEICYREEVACGEAKRCLQCAVRKKLPKVPSPPKKSVKKEEVKAVV
jgi:NADPH-dependent glutamate synthase beta subunit-like oxidoreductase